MEENKKELTHEEFSLAQQKNFAAELKSITTGTLASSRKMYNPFAGFGATSSRNSVLKAASGDVAKWLQEPLANEKQLRDLSRLLYSVSGEYKGLVKYFTDMARFYYVFQFDGTPSEHKPDKLRTELKTLTDEFAKMNIAHEKSKVFATVMKEDVFYGYEISDKRSYFIMKLDPDYCRLSGFSDGMWTFEFDFSYFNGNKDLLKTYPREFETKYNLYLANSVEGQWQSLDFNKSVVYKFNETQTEIVPPLSTTFEGMMDLDEYRGLKKVGAKIDNYLILHQKVPMFKDTDKSTKQNNFMIDSKTMKMFHEMLASSLPEEIGAVVSPMEIEPLKLEKSREPSDKVAEATRDIYNAAGVNQYLFNPDKNSTAGLSKSISKDEASVINFYLQVARWMNRKIKLNHPKWGHWKVQLLGTTYHSEKEYADMLTNLGTLGFPVVGAIASMIGQDIQTVESMSYLENEVLGLKDKMIPFASSHTGGANNKEDSGGRPTLDDDKISDSGQANRDSNNGVVGGAK